MLSASDGIRAGRASLTSYYGAECAPWWKFLSLDAGTKKPAAADAGRAEVISGGTSG